jgi:hypothetical protein
MILTVCSYDPKTMMTLCNLISDPIQCHVRPMLTIVCTDAASAASVYYELFHIIQWLQVSVNMNWNCLYFEFPDYGTDQLVHILLYIGQYYTVINETNSYSEGILYSTTCWIKVPISVQGSQYTVPK